MTAAQRKAVDWLVIAALAVLLGAASGWVSSQRKMSDLQETVNRIDSRVAEMYCGNLPPERRAGCR